MEGKIVVRKLANFLAEDVQMDLQRAQEFVTLMGAEVSHSVLERAFESSKKAHGGAWVGGNMTLTERGVYLNANAMNRAIQTGEMDIAIPLNLIHSVNLTGGFFTKVVEVVTPAGTVKFRCYGAKEVETLLKKMIE